MVPNGGVSLYPTADLLIRCYLRCIPILFPLLVSPTLNVKQFTTCMTVVKEMMGRVEEEHLTRLKQLHQVQS